MTEHQAPLEASLARAFDWWPGDWHATEIKSPLQVAFGLRRLDRGQVPTGLAGLHTVLDHIRPEALRGRNRDAWDAAVAAAQALVRAVRGVVREAVARWRPSTLMLCAEHDLDPLGSRYPAMLEALVEGALLHLVEVTGPEGRALLTVVAATGADGLDRVGTLEQIVERVETLAARLSPAGRMVRLVIEPVLRPADRDTPGLVLADVVTHELGPQGAQAYPASAQTLADWSLAAVHRRSAERFGADVDIAASGALVTRELLARVTCGGIAATEAVALLRALSDGAPLPQGTLRATVDHALAMVERWAAMGL